MNYDSCSENRNFAGRYSCGSGCGQDTQIAAYGKIRMHLCNQCSDG